MSNFTELVRSQRKSGSGVLKSLGTSLGRTVKQKIDPRNYLFKREGLITALFPGLKGYQAKADSEKTTNDSKLKDSGLLTEQSTISVERLDIIINQNKILVKNSLVLPAMHRDINVMRQGILKLVKITGGTQKNAADNYFMKASEQEKIYENKFKKTNNTPTQIKKTENKSDSSSWLSNMLANSGMMGMVVKGVAAGLLAFLVKKYFEDDDFKKTINTSVGKMFDKIIDFMKEHWQLTLGALVALFPGTTLTLIGSGLKVLATALTGEYGLIAAFSRLLPLLMGPVGLVVGLTTLLATVTKLAYDHQQDTWKKNRENVKNGLNPDGSPREDMSSVQQAPTDQMVLDNLNKKLSEAKNDTDRKYIQNAIDQHKERMEKKSKNPVNEPQKTPVNSTPTGVGDKIGNFVSKLLPTAEAGTLPPSLSPSKVRDSASTQLPNNSPTQQYGKGFSQKGSASEAMEFFKNRDWTEAQAAGIVGNLQAESAQFKTDAVGDGGRAYGIAQWHPPRQATFEKVMKIPIRQSNFKQQLEFVDWELKNSHRNAGLLLSQTNDPGQAAAIVDSKYEVSAGFHRQRRIDNAYALLGQKSLGTLNPSNVDQSPIISGSNLAAQSAAIGGMSSAAQQFITLLTQTPQVTPQASSGNLFNADVMDTDFARILAARMVG